MQNREWDHFGTDQPCPYRFPLEKLRQHDREADLFNKSQEFWKGLQGVLTDEGYASNETFNQAVEILKELREAGLQGLEGEKQHEFDIETRWIAHLG
jgi:hypothetical protein